jgi:hypothetical protein
MEGQMSASATTAQAGIGFGGFKSALAALALVVILAATVAVVALGVSRSATPAVEANPIQVPAVLDKGSRDEMNAAPAIPYIIDRDKGAINAFGNETVPGYGGWNGPRQAGPGDLSKDDTYVPARGGGHNGTRFAQ